MELREVPDPRPGTDEALVQVKAVSLNRGEVRHLLSAEDGWRPGWDIAGIVVEAATDGTGPPVGSPVFGYTPGGGWAQLAACATRNLSIIPAGLELAPASTLPIAGLTAYRTLQLAQVDSRKHVVVTGAAGGVGRLAIQLAARAGARVTGVVGTLERAEGLVELGAHDIVTAIAEASKPVDVVLESVGGQSLADAIAIVDHQGVIVSYGMSSGEDTTFNAGDLFRKSARVVGFLVFGDGESAFASDLEILGRMVATKDLVVDVSLELDWTDAAIACRALMDRKIVGKAVLLVR